MYSLGGRPQTEQTPWLHPVGLPRPHQTAGRTLPSRRRGQGSPAHIVLAAEPCVVGRSYRKDCGGSRAGHLGDPCHCFIVSFPFPLGVVFLHMCEHVYANACAHSWGSQRLAMSVFLDRSPTCFWRLRPSLNLEPTVFDRLVGQPASIQDLSVCVRPSAGVTDVPQAQVFHVC